MLVEIQNTQQFDQLVDNYEYPILVYFTAPWCQPCLEFQELIEKRLHGAFRLVAAQVNVDIDENEDVAVRHEVCSVPSVFLYKNGDVVQDNDAYFQGFDDEALTRMITLATNMSFKTYFSQQL